MYDFTQKHAPEEGYLHFSEPLQASTEPAKCFQHSKMLCFPPWQQRKQMQQLLPRKAAKISNMGAPGERVDTSYTSHMYSNLENVYIISIQSTAGYFPGWTVWLA